MQNKIEDIVTTKENTTKNTTSKNDMLSKLTEARDKKSIPNNFQERNNTEYKDENINTEVGDMENHEDEVHLNINVIDKKMRPSINKTIKDTSYDDYNPKKKSKIKYYIFFIILILIAVFFVLNFFARVKVYISPKVEQFSFNNEKFVANKTSSAGLSFEIMIIEGEEEKDVKFSDKQAMSIKSKGTVVVYNEYSTSPQKLLINTRLSDDSGYVYMTDQAVTIPGYTKSGSKIVPGSVTVTATAQNAGEKYNGSAKDFKIIGFKGTSKYEKMYARSKTAFTDGADGTFYTPSATEKGVLKSDFEIKLRESLSKKVEAELPEGYVYYPGSVQFSMSINEDGFLSKTEDAKISAKGKIATVIFKEEDLLKEVIKKAYPNANDTDLKEIDILNIKDLKFNFSDKNYTIVKDTESISFDLSGDGSLDWHPITLDLAKKLGGVAKKDIDDIFKQDPGILKARVVFQPPWQQSIPKDIEKIKIIEE